MSSKINLGEIQETLFIPLYARAVESQKKNPLIQDNKAIEIINQVPYNFKKFKNKPSLFTNVFRTYLFDQWVKKFIQENQQGTIIEMGVGLNTRYERLNSLANQNFYWLEFDLPDSIELRKMFFEEQPNRKILVGSVVDRDWIDYVLKNPFPKPYFIMIEAVLIYLDEKDVRVAIQNIGKYFQSTNSFLAFDSGTDDLIQYQHTHDILKHMNAKLKWALNDLNQITEWSKNIILKETRLLLDLDQNLKKRLKFFHRNFYQLYNSLFLRWSYSYRLNLYEIR
jgi:O-methyltransferase involved in polyketide biosynthesis